MDYIEKELEHKKYLINFYRSRDIGNKKLLTTDHGTWMIFSDEEYRHFTEENMDETLYNEAEQRGLLITSSNYGSIINQYHRRYESIEKGAALHIIVPTIRCNLRCSYCHSEAASITDGNYYDMKEDTLKRTLEFIFQSPNHTITIEFQGGEPLLNKPLIKKTCEYAAVLNQKYRKKYKIALISNFIAMDEDFLQFIYENKDVIHLCTSLDGPEYVHDQNRKYVHRDVGTYKQVTYWIKRCFEKGIKVGMLMVTTRQSLPYWKEIIDEYVRWGQTEIQIKPLDYLGYAVEVWDTIGYTMEEFIDFWKKCVDYTFELLGKGVYIAERYVVLAFKKILTNKNVDFLDLTNPCGAIRGQVVYNYNGDIYCCDEARVMDDFIIGNVFEDNYNGLIQKRKSKEIIMASIAEGYYCDSCVYKPFCGVCPVLGYAQQRSYNIKLNKTNRCKKNRTVFDYVFNKIIYEQASVKQFIMGYMLQSRLDRQS
ncbi:His-Xaa-Ser system radical SAM maturase HxsB [Ruminiclostridium herbifermentans]|uniref:His-Xaa-Ser system radical SAM maturase HxsB n=1 Tax=Ruminiclostridium herbifermentans TaxID=2488810 RepID=A0A4V6EP13_9FIRM|nr:His-Xaa-Ser system radical SAM maturase HxsB [Ruminiclostridium herbifermentans]QNU66189.1 His-Xaa-Ser system radical SAM maturase HxsB [Ruminiclostridium herbifermentans]